MRRREFLEAGGLAALAGLATGCTDKRTAVAAPPTPSAGAGKPVARAALNLAVPKISWERVIRTTVGLRPRRDSGFVLKAEKFDEKTVVHDYGFGGAGMSLAWGCGSMAADMALEHSERKAAVLGCGSPGLTAARELQRRGFDVTIYTMTVPPNTTSNMSWAGYTPTTALISRDKRTPAWDAQFRRAAEISYKQLQILAGEPGYGIYWIDNYSATDDLDSPPRPIPGMGPADEPGDDLVPENLKPGRDREVLGPGEHPFPTKYAVRTSNLAIEPNMYLDKLVSDFAIFGGKIVIRKFDTPRDLMSLKESIIVNCTGLGSKTIFNDNELVPIKGQFTICVPETEVKYRVTGRVPNSTLVASMSPRSDGILIGNLGERGNYSLEPNEEAMRQNVEAAMQFFAAMQKPGGRPASART